MERLMLRPIQRVDGPSRQDIHQRQQPCQHRKQVSWQTCLQTNVHPSKSFTATITTRFRMIVHSGDFHVWKAVGIWRLRVTFVKAVELILLESVIKGVEHEHTGSPRKI